MRDHTLWRGIASWIFLAWAASCSSEETATLSLQPTPVEGAGGASEGATGGSSSTGGGSRDGVAEPVDECLRGCPEKAPYCLNGKCAECSGDSHCEVEDMCDLAAGLCRRACEDANDCDNEDFCSPSGICLECAIDADCSSEEKNRCSSDGRCVDCLSDGDCDTTEDGICDLFTGECVECVRDSDCESGVCDTQRRECGT